MKLFEISSIFKEVFYNFFFQPEDPSFRASGERWLKLYQPSQLRDWRRAAGMEHAPGKKGCRSSEHSLNSHYQLGSQGASDNLKTAEAPLQGWSTNTACLPGRETAKLMLPWPIKGKSMPRFKYQDKACSLLGYHISETEKEKSALVLKNCNKEEGRIEQGNHFATDTDCITPSSVQALSSCIRFSWQCSGCAHLTLQDWSAELSLWPISWVFLALDYFY